MNSGSEFLRTTGPYACKSIPEAPAIVTPGFANEIETGEPIGSRYIRSLPV